MRNEIFIRLRKCIEGGLETKEGDILKLDENTSLLNLGFNSISFIKTIVAIEEEFDIEFSDENLIVERFQTLNDIVDIIEKELNKRA